MPKTKLAFKATIQMPTYMDRPTWHDGDIRDVEREVADRLVKHFPDNFMTPAAYNKLTTAEWAAMRQAAQELLDRKYPSGDPRSANPKKGKTGKINPGDQDAGIDAVLAELDEDQRAIYETATKKVDEGQELDDEESEVLELVESLLVESKG